MGDPFFEAIAQHRDRLRRLAERTAELHRDGERLPAADSWAVAEYAEEPKFRGDWGDEPVRMPHVAGMGALHSAADHAIAACRLYDDDPVPVYAHKTIARGALEAAGRAYHLLRPATVRQRVARGRNERLYSMSQVAQLPQEVHSPKLSERRQAIYRTAETLGFRLVDEWIEERRPGPTKVVVDLYDASKDAKFGGATYNVLSAVAHSTQYGLSLAMTTIEDLPLSGKRGALTASSDDVVGTMLTIGYGLIVAGVARRRLYGWHESDDWQAAAADFAQLVPSSR